MAASSALLVPLLLAALFSPCAATTVALSYQDSALNTVAATYASINIDS